MSKMKNLAIDAEFINFNHKELSQEERDDRMFAEIRMNLKDSKPLDKVMINPYKPETDSNRDFYQEVAENPGHFWFN